MGFYFSCERFPSFPFFEYIEHTIPGYAATPTEHHSYSSNNIFSCLNVWGKIISAESKSPPSLNAKDSFAMLASGTLPRIIVTDTAKNTPSFLYTQSIETIAAFP